MRHLVILGALVVGLVFFSANSFSDTEEIEIMRGQLVCIQVDSDGEAEVSKEFTDCMGLLYLLGVDGKLYSLHGAPEEMERIKKGSKSRMGYRLPLRLKGKAVGHERAWQLYTPALEVEENSIKTTVTGSVLCVFPNYKEGMADPKIAGGPCNEAEPHAHFIKTDDGEIYALHGSLEDIVALEKNPERTNVTVSGLLRANDSGWILYVN
ncbi:MAG: hypothetical protein AAF462_01315 [Thermodesulfobacteriota bacterium]